jgi:hypothetical protein
LPHDHASELTTATTATDHTAASATVAASSAPVDTSVPVAALSNATTDMTSPSNITRDAVLNTPELLEAVVSFLPGRDIIAKAQRVSRTWKDAIAHSPMIHESLWLKSQASKAVCPSYFTSLEGENMYGDPMVPNEYFLRQELPVYHNIIAYNPLHASRDELDDSRSRPKLMSLSTEPRFGLPPQVGQLLFMHCQLDRYRDAVQPTSLEMFLTGPTRTARVSSNFRDSGTAGTDFHARSCSPRVGSHASLPIMADLHQEFTVYTRQTLDHVTRWQCLFSNCDDNDVGR